MKNKLKISVVIPAHNEAKTIGQLLTLLVPQLIEGDEIIVVDNNSLDETSEIARSYPEVKVIKQTVQGIIPSRDKGFHSAKGDIIARIDADCIPNSDWLERIRDGLVDDKYSASTGPFYYFDMPLPKVSEASEWAIRMGVKRLLGDFPFLSGGNMAIKKKVWLRISDGLCKEHNIHEDVDIALHLTDKDLEIFYDEKMVVGTSARRIDDPPARFFEYMQKFSNTYKKHNLSPVAARVPMAIYLWFYPGLKLVRFFYDSDKKKFTLEKMRAEFKKYQNR